MSPHPAPFNCTRCARPGDQCWACAMRNDSDDWHGTLAADLCWHGFAGRDLRYPLCQACARRWRAWRTIKGDLPARLHSIG